MIYRIVSKRLGEVGAEWQPSSSRDLMFCLAAGLVEPAEESTQKPKKSSIIKKAPKE
jgi:hypothetical protein